MSSHLAQHVLRPELRSGNTLHVIGVVSNPVRYHSRYRLARDFVDQMRATPHVRLHMVEAAFGDREHEIANADEPCTRLRTRSEIWNKESMINVGERDLPRDWKYLAWVDADVAFRDPNWAQETLHQLQHFAVVQPWQSCADLGTQGAILQTHSSFGYVHQSGAQKTPKHPFKAQTTPYVYAHSGFAWACTRAFWEAAGGLLDFCIMGSADHHMAWAMVGQGQNTIPGGVAPSYARRIAEWQRRALRVTHSQVGYTPGRIEHAFHGPKRRRYYQERWQILQAHGYDPDADLMHDAQGLVQLTGKPDLEQALRHYNRARLEDSIEET